MAGVSGTSVIVAVTLMLILEPVNVSAQSLDTKLAIYILAGIAGFYTFVTCFCFLLAVCICCNKRRRKTIKKYPYIEVVESLRELHGTVFENKCYVQESEKKDLNTAILKTRADKNVTIIANDYIHAVDMIKKEKFHDSPLARHTPKIITHPVRVPYCDDTSSNNESEPEGAPITQISILSLSDSSKKDQEDRHNPFELKSLKRRGQAGRNKVDAPPSPVKDMSKGHLPQSEGLEMEKHRNIPQTSPLPRSGQTKIAGPDNINKTVTLTKLCTELSSVAPKWYDLGIQLKVSHKTLNAIRAINKRNTEICLMRVCEEWLLQEKKCNVVPAWKTIIEVLNSKVISETELAGRIDQKYCRDETEGEEEEEEEEEPTSKSYTWIN